MKWLEVLVTKRKILKKCLLNVEYCLQTASGMKPLQHWFCVIMMAELHAEQHAKGRKRDATAS